MKLYKPYTNAKYAELAVYCNKNGLIIEDKGDYFESVNPPEKTTAQKADEIRAERDRRINSIRWRIERYQTQKWAGLETTETSETVEALLLYAQYLRDFPQQDGEWWNAPILTFEEWGAEL